MADAVRAIAAMQRHPGCRPADTFAAGGTNPLLSPSESPWPYSLGSAA